jgi:MFS transporter, OFA family, oxalate/formate antiporter
VGHCDRRSVFADRSGRGLCVECFPRSVGETIRLEHFRSNADLYDQHFCPGLCRIFGGLWLNRKGPRVVALTGGVLYELGVFLASFSHNLLWLYLSYGVIGGIGLGLGYIVPVAVLVKWFPDRRGLITGIAVGGFGAGALITAPVATRLIQGVGVLSTFAYLGIAYLIVTVVTGLFMRNPPDGWKPDVGRQQRAKLRSGPVVISL